MADVKPSVSTDGSSLTIALRLARSTLPSERIICVTVGSASGTAAIARATALTNSTSQASPRERPSTSITTIVRPAAAAIQRVSRSSSAVSGVFSRALPDSIAEIFPSSVSAPVPVTIMMPLPCVTGVFMNAMLVWSLAPRSFADNVSALLSAGTLSPVNADSSICRALATTMRPSAGTCPPAARITTSPGTSWSASSSSSAPSRRTRAVALTIDLSAFIALSALPCWRNPTTAFSTVSATSSTAVPHSAISAETTAAAIRMSCM